MSLSAARRPSLVTGTSSLGTAYIGHAPAGKGCAASGVTPSAGRGAGAPHGAQRGDRLVDVLVRVQLARDHAADDAVAVDDESDAPGRQPAAEPRDAEGLADGRVAVGQQGEVEAVLARELLVRVLAVHADPENDAARGRDLARMVAEAARFL